MDASVEAKPLATPARSVSRASRAKKRRLEGALERQALTWGSVLGGLALWEFIGQVVIDNPLFLATPWQTMKAIGKLWANGELAYHAWISMQEFVIGFVIAVVVGIAIGLMTASSKRAASIFNPWVSGIYATPIIAISPLLILWFGLGIWSKVAVVVSLVVFPVIINTEAGIRNTDRQLLEAVRSLDLYLVMGSVLMGSVLLLIGNLLADLALTLVDPRIDFARLEAAR